VSAAPLAHTCQGAGNISTGVRAILYLLRSLASKNNDSFSEFLHNIKSSAFVSSMEIGPGLSE